MRTLSPFDMEPFLDALAERIAFKVIAKLTADHLDGFVDQTRSPLGPRRHIQAIRSGALKGFELNRRWLARLEDVDDYARRIAARPRGAGRARRSDQDPAVTELASELGYASVGAAVPNGSTKSTADSAANARSRTNGAR